MKTEQVLGLLLVGFSLWLIYPGKILPTPLPPEVSSIVAQVQPLARGADAKSDLKKMSGVLYSTANLFVLDEQRPEPRYRDGESLKWVVRQVGDLSYPLGFKMDEKYRGLKDILGGHLESKLGKEFSKQDLVRELRVLAQALENV